jgi:hypothetical protein
VELEALEEVAEAPEEEPAEEVVAVGVDEEPSQGSQDRMFMPSSDENEDMPELEAMPSYEPLPAEPVEELEYLSAVDDEEFEKAEVLSASGHSTATGEPVGEVQVSEGLKELVDSGELLVYSPHELVEIASQRPEAIVMEDGVYKVSERTRRSAGGKDSSDTALGELVGTVIGSGDAGGSGKRFITLSQRGFSYDDFLTQFPQPVTDRVVFRSLIAISQDISAVSVVLLARDGDRGFAPVLNVGIDDDTARAFRFGPDDVLYRDVLSKRCCVLINTPLAGTGLAEGRVSVEDRGYMKREAFLPAVYQDGPAYLFFGFAKERNLDLEYILGGLNVQVASG